MDVLVAGGQCATRLLGEWRVAASLKMSKPLLESSCIQDTPESAMLMLVSTATGGGCSMGEVQTLEGFGFDTQTFPQRFPGA